MTDMSKWLKELAEQAEEWHADGDKCEVNLQKFAELIIRKCISLLPEDCQSKDGCHASWTIKENFGVKE